MTVVAKVDDESSFNRLNGDPSLSAIPSGLEPSHLILKEQRDGSRIGMPLESEGEVWLWALGVEIDHNLLVHVHTSIGQSVLVQIHGLRQHLQQLAGQPHELLAVLLCHRSPPLWLVWPPRVVPGS